MVNSPLEFLAARYGLVVKYDSGGIPAIFCKFPKMKSKDLDSSLPDHVHPAFIVNGVEQDYILIGQFAGCCADGTDDGTITSLPNMPPIYGRTESQLLGQCRSFGSKTSGMTVADRGFLLLLAQKMGWKPEGNDCHGHSSGRAASLKFGETLKAGDERGYRGWLWECLKNHTAAAALAPDAAPQHWKRKREIGGTEAYPDMHDDGNDVTLTLNGSGPLEWYLDGTLGSPCDLVGNQSENLYGHRLVNCELQILENNNAADSGTSLDETGAWKAILPNKADDGYTLVAPGTGGTLHWTWANGKITLDTVLPVFDGAHHATDFRELAANSKNVPYVPAILKELGLFPTKGSTTTGPVQVAFDKQEHFPRAGGDFASGNAGFGSLDCNQTRTAAGRNYGVRLRAMAETTTTSDFVFYGADAASTVTSALVSSLKKLATTTRNVSFNVTAGTGQYIFFALPVRYGTPAFNVNGFTGGFQKVGNIQVDADSFDVWRSINHSLGTIQVNVE